MATRTRIDDPDLADLLEGIDTGRIALPNFQRDFEWSDSDIRALIATVLNGWPMGSLLLIEGDQESEGFYSPRPFEHGPVLRGVPDIIVLDGQQRLTSLYVALYERSDQVYAVSLDADIDWHQIDSIDGAIRSFRRQRWAKELGSPAKQWEKGLLPISSLRSAADFYAWRDAAGMDDHSRSRVTETYRRHLSGLHRYRVPALRIDPDTPPAAVARIFERVNKTGQRLGVFDLMVAKSFTPTFNLREKWEESKLAYPRISAFYEDNGTVPLQVTALRVSEDVRSSAVLGLSSTAIHDNWEASARALDSALDFAAAQFGLARSDWIPYGNLIVVLAALARDVDLSDHVDVLRAWYWASAFSARYAAGSNTTAVADFRDLRSGSWKARDFIIDRRALLESTKQSSGALHRAWLSAMAARQERGARNIGDFGAVSLLERTGSVFGKPQHLLSLGFGLTCQGEVIDDVPLSKGGAAPRPGANSAELEQYLNKRADCLAEFLAQQTGVAVELVDAE